jgi:hypothetical protein
VVVDEQPVQGPGVEVDCTPSPICHLPTS